MCTVSNGNGGLAGSGSGSGSGSSPTTSELLDVHHERTVALATATREVTQRLRDQTDKLYDSLDQCRGRFAAADSNAVATQDLWHKLVQKMKQIQLDLDEAEVVARLEERNEVQDSLGLAIEAIPKAESVSSDIIGRLETAFWSYQSETMEICLPRVTSLQTALAEAREHGAVLQEMCFDALPLRDVIARDIEEATQGIRENEGCQELWATTYENVIRLGPCKLGRVLQRFPWMDAFIREARRELELNETCVRDGINGESGSGSG